MLDVSTQAELDAGLAKAPDGEFRLLKGSFRLTLTGVAAPILIVLGGAELDLLAWGSSQPRVEARESSQPRVVARGSSQPRVVAWGSSQPRVEARESSQPRVEAWGFVQMSLFGKVVGTATANVSVTIEGAAQITGGHQIQVSKATAQEWCDYYGVQVTDGVAILYKGVDDKFRSGYGGDYTPGLTPRVRVFKAEPECAAGALYFSPTPRHTYQFISEPRHYVGCPVRLADIVTHPNGQYPEKVKAIGCCGPVFEVDEDGEPLAPIVSPKAKRTRRVA